jgi:hypothetical protein
MQSGSGHLTLLFHYTTKFSQGHAKVTPTLQNQIQPQGHAKQMRPH